MCVWSIKAKELGINSIAGSLAPIIYSNPTRSDITIGFAQNVTKGSIIMLDAFGKQVLTQNFNDTKSVVLNTGQLAAGIYHIQIDADQSGFGSYRIIKQ